MEELALTPHPAFSARPTARSCCFQALASPLVGIPRRAPRGVSLVLAASSVALHGFVFIFFSGIQGAIGHLYLAIGGAGIGLCAAGVGDVSVGHVVSQWIQRKRRGLALGIVVYGLEPGRVP